jgi:hypothetical protein
MKILSNGQKKVQKVAKIFLVVVIPFIILITIVGIFTDTSNDFRDTKWGMSKEEVKVIESSEINEEDADEIIYKVEHYTQPFFCGYKFENGKLHQGYYIWDGSYLNPDNYIVNYSQLKELLTREYGKPGIDEVIWEDDYPFKTEKMQGYALFTNHVTLASGWETENTKIMLILINNGTEVRLAISYTSKK